MMRLFNLRYVALALTIFPAFSILQNYGQRVLSMLGVEQTYGLGLLAIALYTLVVWAFLIWTTTILEGDWVAGFTNRQANILLAACLVVLLLLFFTLYPLATSGVFGGGSDRDEGLNIAVEAMLAGRYPFYEMTYVPGIPHKLGFDGNPISPMPGELLLAAPFVLMGNGAFQSFAWIPLVAVCLVSFMGSWPKAVLVTVGSFLIFPNLLHELTTGGDILVNGFYVFCGVALLAQLERRNHLMLVALFLGVALSSRLHFLLVAPFIAGICYQRFGLKMSIKLCLLIAFSFLVVTLPFFLYDPLGFSPLHAYSKLGGFDSIVPHVGIIVPLLAGVFSLFCMICLQGRSYAIWFIFVAIGLSIPIVSGTVLRSFVNGKVNFMDFNWYGMSWMMFALAGFYRYSKESCMGSSGCPQNS